MRRGGYPAPCPFEGQEGDSKEDVERHYKSLGFVFYDGDTKWAVYVRGNREVYIHFFKKKWTGHVAKLWPDEMPCVAHN